jgi:FkbM family methyltransferase
MEPTMNQAGWFDVNRMRAFVASRRESLPFRLAATVCKKYLSAYHNLNYDALTNGEAFVLEQLATDPAGVKLVLDVGANEGDWALLAHDLMPGATIHCFEIESNTYSLLRDHTSSVRAIKTNACGLSDSEGEVTLKSYPGANTLTSLFDYPHELEHQTKSARVTTGDLYASANGFDTIDFVKIDVEGAEFLVLKGMSDLIAGRRIGAIQFEYGFANILSQSLLHDMHKFLTDAGYLVGKIYPRYVEFRPYQLADEDFRGPNYLALRGDRKDMLARLTHNGPSASI